MTAKINRRTLLQLSALAGMGGVLAACTPPTQQPAPVQRAAQSMPAASDLRTADVAQAANKFLSALDDAQRSKATYAFNDAERTRWHWTTPRNVPRNGLPLNEMEEAQQTLAMELLASSLSADGFKKSLDIISLQTELGNDPQLYYFTIFGTPSSDPSIGTEPWGWRVEGHHLSRHFTIKGDQIAVTPFFLGAWPTVTDAGVKAMEREEWAARELITSLSDDKRQIALFQARTLSQHVTQNQAYVTPLESVGLPAGEFTPDQQALMMEIIHKYLDTLPANLAKSHLARLQAAGTDPIRFGWAGSLEARTPHYYRLQGPTFLLEYDNSRNGGTHIHSVWRDFAGDFGKDIL